MEDLLLMEEIQNLANQLRLVVYPTVYRVLYIPSINGRNIVNSEIAP